LDLLFALGWGLLFFAFMVVPMFSTANEEFFGIPSRPLMLASSFSRSRSLPNGGGDFTSGIPHARKISHEKILVPLWKN